VLRRLQSAFAAEFTDAYGLTEAASCSTILPGADIPRKPGSAGLPCAHVILRVLGPSSEELGPGEVGEIVQAGPTVMRGYWRRPDETAEALRDGWLHTGDLGTIDEEGYLFMAGRSKDMIVSGGAKVYPAEVERLLREHPSVADAAVIGIPDPDLGEAVAAVVLSGDPALEPEDVLAFCRGRIAEYKCPRVAFLSEMLPRNASGKILKTDLRARYGAPV
jgi:fatty-acyl-CoA synthase